MIQKILNYLKLKKSAPTIEYLQELITAYCTNVPWESVSKIVKKELDGKKDNCIRLEEDFWDSSLKYGTGGTCYESNWAFYTFLQALGFEGYLTINKIVGKSSSHSAIVIKINGGKYIADIGYPVYGPVQIIENSVTLTNTYAYRSTAISKNEYIIENIDHPEPYLYHLIDIPVSPHNYLSVTCDDYGDTGLFSDRIIIRKIINHLTVRFDSADTPYNIHVLHNGTRQRNFINPENLHANLSGHFNMNEDIIRKAFEILEKKNGSANALNYL